MSSAERVGGRNLIIKWRDEATRRLRLAAPYGDMGAIKLNSCADELEAALSEQTPRVTLQMLNTALARARWTGPFDPQKAVDELNEALRGER